jgi:hypothetical protein
MRQSQALASLDSLNPRRLGNCAFKQAIATDTGCLKGGRATRLSPRAPCQGGRPCSRIARR